MKRFLRAILFITSFIGSMGYAAQAQKPWAWVGYDNPFNWLRYAATIDTECRDTVLTSKRVKPGTPDSVQLPKRTKQKSGSKKKASPKKAVAFSVEKRFNPKKVPFTVGKLLAFDYLTSRRLHLPEGVSLPAALGGGTTVSLRDCIALAALPATWLAKKAFFIGLDPAQRSGFLYSLRRAGYLTTKFWVKDLIVGGAVYGSLHNVLTQAQKYVASKFFTTENNKKKVQDQPKKVRFSPDVHRRLIPARVASLKSSQTMIKKTPKGVKKS